MPRGNTQIKITGNVTEALAALEHLGIKAEETGVKVEHTLGRAAHGVGGAFQRLGGMAEQWGIPFSASISKIGEKFAEAETKGAKFSAALGEVGKVALLGGGAGLAAASVASLKLGMDFQDSTTKLVTGAGESEAAIGKVRSGIEGMAASVATTPQQLSDGMYLIESAGYHAADGLKVLRAAAEGAKVGGADLKVVADGLTTAMTDYAVPAKDAATVTSQLVETVASGKTTMGDLAGSLHNVLPAAHAAHIGLAQVLGAMATMTGQGISAQQASQNLANTISSLQNPTQQQAQFMDALGLKATDVAKNLGKNGLTGTLNTLVEAITRHMGPAGTVILSTFKDSAQEASKAKTMLDQLPPSVQGIAKQFLAGSITSTQWRKDMKGLGAENKQLVQEFAATVNRSRGFNDLLTAGGPAAKTFAGALSTLTGGATGMNTALALTGANAKTFSTNVHNIGKASADAKGHVAGFSQTQKDLKFQLDEAKAGIEALGTRFGMWLIPKVQEAIQVVQRIVGWLTQHKAVAEALAVVVGSVLTAAVGSFVAEMTGNFVKSLAEGVTSIGSFIAGLFGVQAAEEETAAVAEETGGGFGPIGMAIGLLIPIIYLFVKHWRQIWSDIKAWAEDAWHFLDGVWQSIDKGIRAAWGAIEDFFKKWWPEILGVFTGGLGFLIGMIVQHWNDITAFTEQLWSDVTGWFRRLGQDIGAIWSAAWKGIETAVQDAWYDVVAPVIRALADGVLAVFGAIIHGAANAFGWVPGVGGKLKQAASAFDGFKAHIDALFSRPSVVQIDTRSAAQRLQDLINLGALAKQQATLITSNSSNKMAGMAGARASGGPVAANLPYLVGEHGPELFTPDASGTIIPAGQTKSMLSNQATPGAAFNGGGGQTVNVTVNTSTPASASDIGREVAWAVRGMGG